MSFLKRSTAVLLSLFTVLALITAFSPSAGAKAPKRGGCIGYSRCLLSECVWHESWRCMPSDLGGGPCTSITDPGDRRCEPE